MQTITTDQDRAALSSVHAALLPIIKLSSPTSHVSMSLIMIMLLVAAHEGKTVREIAKMAGVTQSAASRILLDLSTTNRMGGVGLGLIEQRGDDFDQRFMRSYWSEKGRAIVRQIAGEMDRRQVRDAA